MYYILTVNILKLINNLLCEKSANIFAHASQLFAEVKQELTLDVLHDDVDLAGDELAVVLDDAIVTVLVHLDDSIVLQGAQNFHLLLNAMSRVL